MKQQWEYLTARKSDTQDVWLVFGRPAVPELEFNISDLGAEGWELVAAAPAADGDGWGLFTFKRPKAAPVAVEQGPVAGVYPCPVCKAPHQWDGAKPTDKVQCADCYEWSHASEWIKSQRHTAREGWEPAEELMTPAELVERLYVLRDHFLSKGRAGEVSVTQAFRRIAWELADTYGLVFDGER